jgi:heme-degrading monooxygenase HmoA
MTRVTIMEVTRLRVSPEHAHELREARAGMLADFRTRDGFVRADLVHVGDEEWLDLIVWADSESFAESRRRGADTAAIARFFAAIDEVLSSDEGELWSEG